MTLLLKRLPYSYNALEPHISGTALEIHHARHDRGYLEKTNALVAGTPRAQASLDELVRTSASQTRKSVLFNNAAQAWNHGFLWRSMSPGGGKLPSGRLANLAESEFGGPGALLQAFQSAANDHFGSGWASLVLERGHLKVTMTSNADLPLVHGQNPLLAVDLWEHDYYMDFQNKRGEYVSRYLTHLANWDFANENLRNAEKSEAAE